MCKSYFLKLVGGGGACMCRGTHVEVRGHIFRSGVFLSTLFPEQGSLLLFRVTGWVVQASWPMTFLTMVLLLPFLWQEKWDCRCLWPHFAFHMDLRGQTQVTRLLWLLPAEPSLCPTVFETVLHTRWITASLSMVSFNYIKHGEATFNTSSF